MIRQAAERFGSQCIVLAIDANRVRRDGGEFWEVFINGGRTPTGIEVVERLVEAAAARLVPGGWLLVEIGPAVVAAAAAAIRDHDAFEPAPTLPDLAGLPRIVQGRRRG